MLNWGVNKCWLLLVHIFFLQRKVRQEMWVSFRVLKWAWIITELWAQKYCGPKQEAINNILDLMWIIFMLLQVCQVCTKQKERNTCGQQNPKKIGRLWKKEVQMEYIVTTEKKRDGIMKRPELGLGDVSEESYWKNLFAWFCIFVSLAKVKKKSKWSVSQSGKMPLLTPQNVWLRLWPSFWAQWVTDMPVICPLLPRQDHCIPHVLCSGVAWKN